MERKISLLLGTALLLTGCNTTATNDPNTFVSECSYSELQGDKPLQFKVTGQKQATLNGIICSGSLDAYYNMLATFPFIEKFNIETIAGSADDETNLLLSTTLHQDGINTHLKAGGMIASGGTDLFLAGVKRSAEDTEPKIGVHSWSDSEGRAGNEIPRDDAEHQSYLNYYQAIRIDPEFYWYTLNAAPAENMHWMTRDEITRYQVLTP